MQNRTPIKFNLLETYSVILKLFEKQCIRQFTLVSLTFGIGFAATTSMTMLTLFEYGITRDTLALLNIPLLLPRVLVPLCMSEIQRPLLWFARGYIPRLISCIVLAIYIFFTPQLLQRSYFYPMLIVFLSLYEALVFFSIVSCIGFCTRISEPNIAGTYMTLLGTIFNLGSSLLSTLVLYTADWLPKPYAYSIEVGVCFVLGLIWIRLFWSTMKHLDNLPVEDWYLKHSVND